MAVSATDAQDRLFSASNRGGYIAVAAPGVAPAALPVAAASNPRSPGKTQQQQDVPPTRAPDTPIPAMAADEPANGPDKP
jgi:hypothetical protein